MYDVKYTAAYRWGYKRIKKRGLDVTMLNFVINELRNGRALEKKFCDHALKGEYADFRECHIKPDWLLVYMIEDDILTLTLIDTGTHAEIFDK